MSRKTSIVVVICAVIVVALTVAWKKYRHIREEEIALAAVIKQQARVNAEVQRTKEHLAASENDRADLQTELDALQKAKEGTAVIPQKNAPGGPALNLKDAIMKDPKLQNLFLASQHADIAKNYGPFFRNLGLTPAQIGKFENIMIKRAEQDMDLQAVAQSLGLAPDSPTVSTLRKKAEDETRTAETELLGEADYSQLQQYERTVGVRGVVQNFAGAAALEGMSLTPQQAESLTQALASVSAPYQSGGNADYMAINWKAADLQAKAILSETQFGLYRQIEPMGGGPSRFSSQLNNSFKNALKADQSNSSAPVIGAPKD